MIGRDGVDVGEVKGPELVLNLLLLALLAYGNRHFAPEGASVIVVDAATGEPVEPAVVDKRTGRVLAEPEFAVVAGPAASEATKARLAARGARVAVR